MNVANYELYEMNNFDSRRRFGSESHKKSMEGYAEMKYGGELIPYLVILGHHQVAPLRALAEQGEGAVYQPHNTVLCGIRAVRSAISWSRFHLSNEQLRCYMVEMRFEPLNCRMNDFDATQRLVHITIPRFSTTHYLLGPYI